MMRKNVKRAPPSTKGGINSCTMYRSRTSDLTALLYHSPVYRPSQPLLTIALALAALAGLGGAAVGAAGVPDRLDPVREVPLPPQAPAPTSGELTAHPPPEVYQLPDRGNLESPTAGATLACPG